MNAKASKKQAEGRHCEKPMKRFSITGTILEISEKLKPQLVKLLPISFLRRTKTLLVKQKMSELGASAIEAFEKDAYPSGVNLFGYIKGEIGLGESCRLVASSLQRTGIDFTIFNYELISAMSFNDASWDHKISNTAPYNINLLHIQPYELPLAYSRLGREIWDKRYNIVFWLWELERFPAQWENALSLADEIWTPSEFASNSIRAVTSKPVFTMPYGMSPPNRGEYGRAHFKLPVDKFLFLCLYDSNSYSERKNPAAAIAAYRYAFSKDEENVGLIIKLNNPQKADIQMIQSELSGLRNIYFMTDVLEKTQVNALIACADAYVSLHRSEGFGLVPAEAMLLGTPVIATNWSANTEFMDADTACMVEYSFVTIEKDQGPYEAGNRWADPDIEQAAGYMRMLYEDRESGSRIADKAKAHITEKLSPKRAAELISNRINEINN